MKRLIPCIAILLSVAACEPARENTDEPPVPPNPPAPPPVATTVATLDGEWVFESLETADGVMQSPAGAVRPTIMFTEQVAEGDSTQMQLAGSGGCNRITGTYQRSGLDEISLSELGSTRMACPDSIMAVEQALLQSLTQVTTYRISGSELMLEFPGGTARYAK